MRVDEVMSRAKCCREEESARECARLMKQENIGFVPICNDDGEPVGAVTDRDLAIRILADGRPLDERCSAIMTRDVVACRIGDDVDEAERLMRDHRKSRIMVCDDSGKLQGVISLQDIAESESDESAGRTLQEVKSDRPSASH
jgi:CBS domain-containing protein